MAALSLKDSALLLPSSSPRLEEAAHSLLPLPPTDSSVRKLLFEAHFPHLTLLDPVRPGAKLTRAASSDRKTM